MMKTRALSLVTAAVVALSASGAFGGALSTGVSMNAVAEGAVDKEYGSWETAYRAVLD